MRQASCPIEMTCASVTEMLGEGRPRLSSHPCLQLGPGGCPSPRLPLLLMGLEPRPAPGSTPDLCPLKARSPNPLIVFKRLIEAVCCYHIHFPLGSARTKKWDSCRWPELSAARAVGGLSCRWPELSVALRISPQCLLWSFMGNGQEGRAVAGRRFLERPLALTLKNSKATHTL